MLKCNDGIEIEFESNDVLWVFYKSLKLSTDYFDKTMTGILWIKHTYINNIVGVKIIM